MDEDELKDNAEDFLDGPITWADLRLRKSGRELAREQEADYLGYDPDEYDY